MPQIKPRDYQQEAIDALKEGRRNGKNRQLVALPTGSGKTIVAALDIMDVVKTTGKGAIFMAHRDELISQAANKIQLVWEDIKIGRVKAEDNFLGNPITVASVQTIQRDARLDQIATAQKYSLLYIDEAHHAAAATYQKIINRLVIENPNIIIVGLTATPVRADATKLSTVFNDITYQRTMLELIEAGYLADLQLRQIPLNISIDGIPKEDGDFKPEAIRQVLEQPGIMVEMADAWKAHAKNRRTIAFAVNVEHAMHLAATFNSRGIKSDVIYSGCTDRSKILTRFQNGELDILVNCMILTEGFDDISTCDKPLACIMLARPTLSQSLYIQQVGRGTRLAPNKDDCLILDFSYNSEKHHVVQLPHLFGMDAIGPMKKGKKKPEKEVKEKHIQSILAAVQEARSIDVKTPPPRAGFRWAKLDKGFALSIGKNHGFIIIREDEKQVKKFNVLHYCPPQRPQDGEEQKPTNAVDYGEIKLTSNPLDFDWAFGLAEDSVRNLFESRSRSRSMVKLKSNSFIDKDASWTKLPPTEQQLRVLSRFNKKPQNRGEATDMITSMIVERMQKDREPATEKQIKFMNWKHIPFKPGVTKGEAKTLITNYQSTHNSAPAKPQTAYRPPDKTKPEPKGFIQKARAASNQGNLDFNK
jgi:superfamily II DNA or RNA helicase